jgi:hypothetical protein
MIFTKKRTHSKVCFYACFREKAICNLVTLLLFLQRELRKIDQKYLESFEMWCWRRMEKISWTDRVRNAEVLSRRRGISYMQ